MWGFMVLIVWLRLLVAVHESAHAAMATRLGDRCSSALARSHGANTPNQLRVDDLPR